MLSGVRIKVKSKVLLVFVVADQRKLAAHQLFILLFLYKQTVKTTFVKAVVEHTVACGEEGQTLLLNDRCHSFNTANWTS